MNEDIEQEMEEVDFLVCAVAAGLEGDADNTLHECCQCGIPIICPARMPSKPKKVCMRCAVEMMTAKNTKQISIIRQGH